MCILKTIKQIARDNTKLDDQRLEKEIAKKMTKTFYFSDENLKIGFKFNLESHNINHANSILSIIPMYPDFGIETRYNNKITKEKATTYARLKNQIMFK